MPVEGLSETIKSISANSISSEAVPAPTVSTGTTMLAILRNPLVVLLIIAIIVGVVLTIFKNKNK